MRTIQLSDSSNSIDRALTMLPELVEKLTTLVKKDAKHPQRSPRQSNLLYKSSRSRRSFGLRSI